MKQRLADVNDNIERLQARLDYYRDKRMPRQSVITQRVLRDLQQEAATLADKLFQAGLSMPLGGGQRALDDAEKALTWAAVQATIKKRKKP